MKITINKKGNLIITINPEEIELDNTLLTKEDINNRKDLKTLEKRIKKLEDNKK